MAASTIYDIKLRYLLDDRATRGLSNIAQAADRAEKRSSMLRSGLGKVAAIGMGHFGIQRAGKALLGFNSDLEQARITMAGMIQMNAGKTFAEGMSRANEMVARFQEIAKASVGTTADFVDMASMITRPVLKAKLEMKDLVDITKGGVIAARAMNIEAEMAAMDIEQILAGQVGKRDRFARALLEPFLEKNFGIVAYMQKTKAGTERAVTAMEQFNKLTEQQRAQILRAALTQPAIEDMAKAQEQSFAGAMSTFEDSVQMFLGKVGLPLFQKLTAEVQKWNTWIDKNPEKIQKFAEKFGGALVEGFSVLKAVAEFFVEHSDLLLTIAKAWVGMKLGSQLNKMAMGGGALLGTALKRGGGIAGILGFDRVMLSSAKMGAGLMDATSKLSAWGAALGLAGLAVKGVYDLFTEEDRQKKQREREKFEREMNMIEKFISPTMGGTLGREKTARSEMARLEELLRGTEFRTPEGLKTFEPTRFLEIQKLVGDLESTTPRIQEYYKNLAEQAQQANLFTDRFLTNQAGSNFTDMMRGEDFDRAVNQMAVNLGLSRDNADYLAQDLKNLAFMLSQSQDRTQSFGMMLKGDFVPDIIAAGRAFIGTEKPDATAMDPSLVAALEGIKPGKSKVDVRIQKIEIQSDDPDRFVRGMVSALSDAAKNPSGALERFREG